MLLMAILWLFIGIVIGISMSIWGIKQMMLDGWWKSQTGRNIREWMIEGQIKDFKARFKKGG